MAYLKELRVSRLRALEAINFKPDPRANLITGPNGAGKTTILESIFLLSRGRSFRGSDVRQLIGHEAKAAQVSGTVADGERSWRMGLTVSGNRVRTRLDGTQGGRRADLARILPVLSLDARVMDLVDKGPERRRLLLNWVTFHVEPTFNQSWRRFRRTLRQRNAGLREGARAPAVVAWDREFCRAAEAMEGQRRAVSERLRPRFAKIARELMGLSADWDYYPGWPRDDTLADILKAGLDGDRRQGRTRFGPQRSDLILRLESKRARYVASRGQQKLLAASLMLAASQLLEQTGVGRPVLLADEPLVELDDPHAEKLLNAMRETKAQLFIAAVEAERYREVMAATEIGLREGSLV